MVGSLARRFLLVACSGHFPEPAGPVLHLPARVRGAGAPLRHAARTASFSAIKLFPLRASRGSFSQGPPPFGELQPLASRSSARGCAKREVLISDSREAGRIMVRGVVSRSGLSSRAESHCLHRNPCSHRIIVHHLTRHASLYVMLLVVGSCCILL